MPKPRAKAQPVPEAKAKGKRDRPVLTRDEKDAHNKKRRGKRKTETSLRQKAQRRAGNMRRTNAGQELARNRKMRWITLRSKLWRWKCDSQRKCSR